MIRRRRLRSLRGWAFAAVLLLVAVLVNVPTIVMVLNSVKPEEEVISRVSLLPNQWTLENYAFLLLRSGRVPGYLRNSLIVAVAGTILTIGVSVLAGYALARFRNRALALFSRSLLALQMFPIFLMLIPLFIVFRALGLINTYPAPILIDAVLLLPYCIWIAKSFFDELPKELEEAGWCDGASRLQTLRLIVLPLTWPGVASVMIFSFLFIWNEYLIASIFLRDERSTTLPVGVQLFVSQFSAQWGSVFAAASIAMIPSVVFFLILQRRMVAGALAGSFKG